MSRSAKLARSINVTQTITIRSVFAICMLGCGLLVVRSAEAQSCDAVPLSGIGSLAGERIASVEVSTLAPDRMPGAAGALSVLHVRSGKEMIARQLLFRAGEPFDTLRALESIRRLRRQPYLADASVDLNECVDSANVSRTLHIKVVTRDSWSTQPTIKVRSSSTATVGLEERNILGTGRSMKAYVGSDAGRIGLGVAYTDPWLFDSPLSATLSRNVFRDGRDWRATLATRPHSVFDRWNAELSLARSRRISLVAPDSLQRSAASLIVNRLWRSSTTSATSVIAGVEGEKTQMSVSNDMPLVGPPSVNRSFVGFDLGLTRHSALYQVVDWYLPGSAATDLPLGFEGEGVIGLGRDFAAHTPAVHVDTWGGRIWMPRHNLFATTDLWVNGFVHNRNWSAGSTRAAFSLFKQAPRGMWMLRLAGEQLTDPDPDVRALATIDPTLRALPQRSRLAESALAASLERSAHLVPLTRGYVIDGALFGALSSRWDPAASKSDRVSLGVVGAGFRLTPTRLGRASVRFDVGYPVIASPGVARRLFFGVTLSPWIEAGRSRAGAGPH